MEKILLVREMSYTELLTLMDEVRIQVGAHVKAAVRQVLFT